MRLSVTLFVLAIALSACGGSNAPERPRLSADEKAELSNHQLVVYSNEVVAHEKGAAPAASVASLNEASEWMIDLLDAKACAKTSDGTIRSIARDWTSSYEVMGLSSSASDLRDAVSDSGDCSRFV